MRKRLSTCLTSLTLPPPHLHRETQVLPFNYIRRRDALAFSHRQNTPHILFTTCSVLLFVRRNLFPDRIPTHMAPTCTLPLYCKQLKYSAINIHTYSVLPFVRREHAHSPAALQPYTTILHTHTHYPCTASN